MNLISTLGAPSGIVYIVRGHCSPAEKISPLLWVGTPPFYDYVQLTRFAVIRWSPARPLLFMPGTRCYPGELVSAGRRPGPDGHGWINIALRRDVAKIVAERISRAPSTTRLSTPSGSVQLPMSSL